MDCEPVTSSSYEPSECLLSAVLSEEVNIVKSLLSRGDDVNMKGIYGETPLHIAAKNGYLDIVKILIQHGASVNVFTLSSYRFVYSDDSLYCKYPTIVKNDDDTSVPDYAPLHLATLNRNISVIKFLLEHGANIDMQDKDGKTALFIAVERDYCKIVDLFLLHNPDVNNNSNKRALEMAVFSRNDNLRIIQHLYDYGFRIGVDCDNSITLIKRVIEKRVIQVLEDLITQGANINFKDIKNGGFSPLHMAVVHKNEKICEILIKNKAEINVKDNRGNSPIFYAIENGDVKISKLLLDNGANLGNDVVKAFNIAVESNYSQIIDLIFQHDESFNVSSFDNDGRTPLDSIVSHGNNFNLKETIMKLLLMKGADVNCRSVKGITPLYVAAKKGFSGIVKILLKCNVDVNALENDGSCALHAAISGGHLQIVELLLKRDCNINIKNALGSTPLHIAVENNHIQICELLLKFGADYGLKYNNGNTVLHLACEKGYEEIVKVILETICFNIFKNCCLSIDSFDNFCKCGLMVISNTFKDFIDAENDDSLTSLMIGAKSNSDNIVEVLLNFGADVHSVDNEDRTALHFAADLGHYDVFPALFEFGADINATADLTTPFEFALRCTNYSGQICVDMLHNQAIKFYVAELYHFCSRFLDQYDELYYGVDFEEELSFFVKPCREELSAMKKHFILKDVSFHDVLTTKNIPEFLLPARTKDFIKSFYSFDHVKMFPIYSDVLSYLFRLIIKRNSLFLECIMWLDSIASSSFSVLPSICIEKILAELSNKCLINVIEACRPTY